MSYTQFTDISRQRFYEDKSREIDQALETYAQLFGQQLKSWRNVNGWSQDTTQTWRAHSGVPLLLSPQWSRMERGLTPRPAPKIFVELELLNKLIYHRQLPNTHNPEIQRQVVASVPVIEADGYLWLARDFMAAFVGQKVFPQFLDIQSWLDFRPRSAAAK